MDFTGVDIRGPKFGKDNYFKTRDGLNSFNGAIYDETTTYDGVPFTEIYGQCQNIETRTK